MQAPTVEAVEPNGSGSNSNLWKLTLGSIGVVYGDIGTSPLYALREALHARRRRRRSPSDEVIGIVSLLLWALILIVTLKYVVLILRADNRGEGGTLSLLALAQQRGRPAHAASVRARRRSARRCSTATRSSRRRSRCCRPSRA